jgi:crossover junction endodeoxyribonuclease RuvC
MAKSRVATPKRYFEARPRVCISIDPGRTGAIAVTNIDEQATFRLVELVDMPLEKLQLDKRVVQRPNPEALFQFFRRYSPRVYPLVIEQQTPRFGEGGKSVFSTAYGYGMMIGLARALGFRIYEIPPAVWKRRLQLRADKAESRLLAATLVPRYGTLFERVRDDGRAEAILLGYWAMTYGY